MDQNVALDPGLAAILIAVVAILAAVGLGLLRRLRQSESRYRALIEHLPHAAVAILDRDLRFELIAGPAIRGLGWDRKFTGRTPHDVVPGEQAEMFALHCRAALRGESRSIEYHSPTDGRAYWLNLVPLSGAWGEITHVMATVLDIDDRRRAEDELRERIGDMDTVAEATRALAHSTDSAAARAAICDGARRVSDAPVAALFEPSSDGRGLSASTAVGARLGGMILPFSGEPSGAARAFASAAPFFAARTRGEAPGEREFLRRTGAVSALWQPVLRDRAAVGVLAVAWRDPVDEVPPRLAAAMELIAAEAAVAIGRADLLARLERMVRTDDLTGLPNRRAWEEALPRELARSWREDRPLCVAMIDLDHFKSYNDARGHLAGDRLLKQAAGAWRTALRPYDVLARYGGEEFALIVPACGLDAAADLVERLRAVTPEGQSCSAGVAEWDRDEQPESLVARADSALYEAKRSGRDRIVAASVPVR
jgi:diguanylate cyclase (GGDEF)-like protein/PAS domain S-box-containing protein